jgi:hypothetical protein
LTKFSAFVALSISSISVGKKFEKVLVYFEIAPKHVSRVKLQKMYSYLSVFIFITAHETEMNIIFGICEKNCIDLSNFSEKKIPDEKLTCRGPQTKFC